MLHKAWLSQNKGQKISIRLKAGAEKQQQQAENRHTYRTKSIFARASLIMHIGVIGFNNSIVAGWGVTQYVCELHMQSVKFAVGKVFNQKKMILFFLSPYHRTYALSPLISFDLYTPRVSGFDSTAHTPFFDFRTLGVDKRFASFVFICLAIFI